MSRPSPSVVIRVSDEADSDSSSFHEGTIVEMRVKGQLIDHHLDGPVGGTGEEEDRTFVHFDVSCLASQPQCSCH